MVLLWQVEEQSVTQRTFPMLFSGGELIVAGKLKEHVLPDLLFGHVIGSSLGGSSVFSSPGVAKASSLERLWAYLTIQQLMEKHDLQGEDYANSTESKDSKRKALELALKVQYCHQGLCKIMSVLQIQIFIEWGKSKSKFNIFFWVYYFDMSAMQRLEYVQPIQLDIIHIPICLA